MQGACKGGSGQQSPWLWLCLYNCIHFSEPSPKREYIYVCNPPHTYTQCTLNKGLSSSYLIGSPTKQTEDLSFNDCKETLSRQNLSLHGQKQSFCGLQSYSHLMCMYLISRMTVSLQYQALLLSVVNDLSPLQQHLSPCRYRMFTSKCQAKLLSKSHKSKIN